MMSQIKNFEVCQDNSGKNCAKFICKIFEDNSGNFLFEQTNITDDQYINFAKDLIQSIHVAREAE